MTDDARPDEEALAGVVARARADSASLLERIDAVRIVWQNAGPERRTVVATAWPELAAVLDALVEPAPEVSGPQLADPHGRVVDELDEGVAPDA
jgi:hypothetical protein